LSKLPQISWRELLKVLGEAGFHVARQRGSHIVLIKNDTVVPIPRHDQIKRGTLQAIIAEAGLTREEFLTLYRKGQKD
jgi:predicted RNA binding protein YcfA (HicA-like mRNA interferase family)